MDDKMTYEYDLIVSHEDGSKMVGVIMTQDPDRTVREIAADGFLLSKKGQMIYIPPGRIKLITLLEKTT